MQSLFYFPRCLRHLCPNITLKQPLVETQHHSEQSEQREKSTRNEQIVPPNIMLYKVSDVGFSEVSLQEHSFWYIIISAKIWVGHIKNKTMFQIQSIQNFIQGSSSHLTLWKLCVMWCY